MGKLINFLFGENSNLFADLEEEAERDIELLRDILFLHRQKMEAIRELSTIWKFKRNVSKIDKIGLWIKDYNEKLGRDIKKVLRIRSREESIVNLLIARNEEVAGEFKDYDIGLLLRRVEGQLGYLKTILLELYFIIKEQIRYIVESRKGIVAILKEIEEHEKFYLLLKDELELEVKIHRLVKMLDEEAVVLHKEKEFKAKGPIIIEEVYSPYSAELKLLHRTVYRKYFPDKGELLALEDIQEELEKRYERLEAGYYHILIVKVGTAPVGGIMFDLYLIDKTVCVGLIYYFFVEKELLATVEEGNKASKMLIDATVSLMTSDAQRAGYKEVNALIGEVDNPERKLRRKLSYSKKLRLNPEESESYKRELEKVIRLYRINGFRRADFKYTPPHLKHPEITLTYLDFYVKPLRANWAKGLHSSNFIPILTAFLQEGYEMKEKDIRYKNMKQEVLQKPRRIVKLV